MEKCDNLLPLHQKKKVYLQAEKCFAIERCRQGVPPRPGNHPLDGAFISYSL